MRSNTQELSFLAHLKSKTFDHEGILWLQEKTEGFFRKGLVYVEHLFRLRGNLLFYFKTKDANSECIGTIVLEKCMVQLENSDDYPFAFALEFEYEDGYHFAAVSEQERDGWISALHIASYQCLRLQITALAERLKLKKHRCRVNSDMSHRSSFESMIEMSVSCEGLESDVAGRLPNVMVAASRLCTVEQRWITLANTEIIECSVDASFLSLIDLKQCDMDDSNNARIRMQVYDVRERVTNTMVLMGTAVFDVDQLFASKDCTLQLSLMTYSSEPVGKISVVGWKNSADVKVLENDANPSPKLIYHRSSSVDGHADALSQYYRSMLSRRFCFPNTNNQQLIVNEFMAESAISYTLPMKLLKVWIEEEKVHLEALKNLGTLSSALDEPRRELMDDCMSLITTYTQAHGYLSNFAGCCFKPSVKKNEKEVEFVPTNLHLHRTVVSNNEVRDEVLGCYDITTVGAFTAYPHRYKAGGLRRMIQCLKDNSSIMLDGRLKIEQVKAMRENIKILHDEIYKCCENLCRSTMQAARVELQLDKTALTEKTQELVELTRSSLLEQGSRHLNKMECMTDSRAHLNGERSHTTNHQSAAVAAPNERLVDGVSGSVDTLNDHDRQDGEKWQWSGTDFVKSDTDEPWELCYLNVEAALVCVTSQLDELLSDSSDASQWLTQLSPLVIKLKACVQVLCQRAMDIILILIVQESRLNIQLIHTMKYRRDVVFSQALTAAVSGIITKFYQNLKNEEFWTQILQLGVLLEFEGLLSCHGFEIGMIEDMDVGTTDLAKVKLKIVCEDDDHKDISVQGNRDALTVVIPLSPTDYAQLPECMKRGTQPPLISVCPVFFNIGINEQATLAGRFGDLTIQEVVNIDNYHRLTAYVTKYTEILGDPPDLLENTLRHLHINVHNKKTKNVEVLHLAAQICRSMNGVRFTSCKSAKDRTAMSVTLEQVRMLEQNHALASHVFIPALQCIRSEGLRLENTLKNVGVRKYAFVTLQLLSMPRLYRAPPGTYGRVQT